MSQRFRVCDLNQPLLLPPSLQDWLPEGHLARFVSDIVDGLCRRSTPLITAKTAGDWPPTIQ